GKSVPRVGLVKRSSKRQKKTSYRSQHEPYHLERVVSSAHEKILENLEISQKPCDQTRELKRRKLEI
ncbi:hypothetical protein HAX54_038612, partial [Datura stramonium]|nr:hypothetical protein [Datura stramonium]